MPAKHLAKFSRMAWLALLAAASGFSPASAQPAVAEAPAPAEQTTKIEQAEDRPGAEWVRVTEDKQGRPLGMQTAIVRYVSKPTSEGKAIAVDLIGAVHVGDLAYYTELNKRFEQYDALLYELVAPPGTRIEPGTKASNRHMLGAMQNSMKNMLKLEHQLEKIDYTKPNFVHADMSADQFFKSMDDRGESLVQMYFRMLGQSIAHQTAATSKGASADIDLMRALFAKDRSRQLKIAMARQMAEMESLLTAFGGEEGSTIITERNKTALRVLQQQLEGGNTKVGVFYGAGHLDDMDNRLRDEFGLEPVSVTWLTAWDLSADDQ